ncbi:MAG: thioredoxin domain-containing protein [Saprospiraceae bacterium]
MNFDFDTAVLQRSNTIPVLVEFSAPGCGPCKWMEKTLVDIVRSYKDRFEFVSLPVQDCADFIDNYKIISNSTTILFINGYEKARLKGAFPKIVIEQWLDDHLVKDKASPLNKS